MPKIGNKTKGFASKPFAEGGVMQEGGTVDPVSGNDVPVGSMQEEVRDDIPAQLSEGEFVFPADVVRFYGLEKLMMMRDKAKKGLQRMNDIGQMGNAEEVEDGEALFGGGEGEMDDDAFSSEIDSIMAEDSGGETRGYAKGGDVRKYAPGGYVGGESNKQLYRDAPIKGFEMVPMVNDDGQTIFIPFINGVAQLGIPTGYKVKKANDVAKVDDKATTTTDDTSGAGGDSGDSGDAFGGGNTDGTTPGGGTGSGPSPGFTIGEDGVPTANITSPTIGSLVGAVVGLVMGVSPVIGAQAGKSFVNQSNTTNITAAQTQSTAFADNMAMDNSPAATAGPSGTGGAAASAATSAAVSAQAAGHSSEAQAAAAQTAANATIGGATPAQAAEQGNAAAVSVTIGENNAAAAANTSASTSADTSGPVGNEGTATGNDAGVGDAAPGGGEAPGVGDAGSATAGDGSGPGSGDGDGGYAKGGFVSKRKAKKTVVKNKGLASR